MNLAMLFEASYPKAFQFTVLNYACIYLWQFSSTNHQFCRNERHGARILFYRSIDLTFAANLHDDNIKPLHRYLHSAILITALKTININQLILYLHATSSNKYNLSLVPQFSHLSHHLQHWVEKKHGINLPTPLKQSVEGYNNGFDL